MEIRYGSFPANAVPSVAHPLISATVIVLYVLAALSSLCLTNSIGSPQTEDIIFLLNLGFCLISDLSANIGSDLKALLHFSPGGILFAFTGLELGVATSGGASNKS